VIAAQRDSSQRWSNSTPRMILRLLECRPSCCVLVVGCGAPPSFWPETDVSLLYFVNLLKLRLLVKGNKTAPKCFKDLFLESKQVASIQKRPWKSVHCQCLDRVLDFQDIDVDLTVCSVERTTPNRKDKQERTIQTLTSSNRPATCRFRNNHELQGTNGCIQESTRKSQDDFKQYADLSRVAGTHFCARREGVGQYWPMLNRPAEAQARSM
jgi:hypothetical protein